MLKQKPRLEPKLFVDPFTGGPTAIPAGRQLPLPVADGLASQAIQLAESKRLAAQLARAAALSLLESNGSIPRERRQSGAEQTRKLGDQITALLTAADAGVGDTTPAGRTFASAVAAG